MILIYMLDQVRSDNFICLNKKETIQQSKIITQLKQRNLGSDIDFGNLLCLYTATYGITTNEILKLQKIINQ